MQINNMKSSIFFQFFFLWPVERRLMGKYVHDFSFSPLFVYFYFASASKCLVFLDVRIVCVCVSVCWMCE